MTKITDDQIKALQNEAWERNDGALSALCSHALRPDDGSTIIVCADTITDKEYTRDGARQACAAAINAHDSVPSGIAGDANDAIRS